MFFLQDVPSLRVIYCGKILVFSNYFRTEFGAFSTFKYTVKWGTDSCKLFVIIKVKDLVEFYKWGCGLFYLSLLTDRRLKALSYD